MTVSAKRDDLWAVKGVTFGKSCRETAMRPARACSSARSVAEGGEDSARQPIVGDVPFRMPLHAKREGPRARIGAVGEAYGLDHTIGRRRFDRQTRRQAIDRLGVQRVNLRLVRSGESGQQATGSEMDGMDRGVAYVVVFAVGSAVIARTGEFVNVLVERATERHIELLNAAAQAQYRHARGDGATDQR